MAGAPDGQQRSEREREADSVLRACRRGERREGATEREKGGREGGWRDVKEQREDWSDCD